MFKEMIFAVCCSANLVALTCSNPVTVSTPGQNCGISKVAMNENGDIAVIWDVGDEVTDDEYLYTAVKKKNGQWGPSSLFASHNDWMQVKKFKIDSSSCLQAVLQLAQNDSADILQWVEKKWGDSLPTVIGYPQPFPNFYSSGKSLNENGKLNFIEEVPGNSNSKKIVVASAIPGQPEMTHMVIGQCEGWISTKNTTFNGKNRAIALWIESTYDLKNYKSVYTLKMARENEDGSWALPKTVSDKFDSIYGWKVRADLHSNVALIWEKDEELYAMIQENWKWSEPVMIAPSEQKPESFRLTFDKEGNLLATWEGKFEKKDAIYAAYKPLGKPWQSPVLITPANSHILFYNVKTDNCGKFVMIWQQRVTKKMGAVYGATFSTQSEKWSLPVQLSPPDQNCRLGSFTLSGNGKGALSWLLIDKCYNGLVQVSDLVVD